MNIKISFTGNLTTQFNLFTIHLWSKVVPINWEYTIQKPTLELDIPIPGTPVCADVSYDGQNVELSLALERMKIFSFDIKSTEVLVHRNKDLLLYLTKDLKLDGTFSFYFSN